MVKFSLCLIKHQVINMYWGVKLTASRFRNLGTSQFTSRPLYHGERSPGIHYLAECVCPEVESGSFGHVENSLPCGDLNSDPSVSTPVP